MEKISIILPSYNSSNFISETIESVINQTYQNWELIIVDDSSTDNTVSIIKKYCEQDFRIKFYLNDKNCGAAISRNVGLKNASGRFVSFIDSDDIWSQEKIEIQVRFMLSSKTPISFTSYNLINENGLSLNKVINSVKKIDYKGYLKNTIIGMSTSMIDKSIVGAFKFIDIRTRQDTYLWISLLKQGYTALGIDDVLVSYRVRDNSISSNKFKAAKQVWFLYFRLEKLGLLRSIYYFIFYIFNAIKKRV